MSKAAYKLWYEYLKETPHEWSTEVREDFAGVLTTKDFREWFSCPRLRLGLFAIYGMRSESHPIRVVTSKKDQQWIADWLDSTADQDDTLKSDDEIDPESHTVLIIDLNQPRAVLMEKIERILKRKQVKKTAGRPAWKSIEGKYPFARRPDLSSLEFALTTWRIRKDHRDWKLWMIGNELTKHIPSLRKHRIETDDQGKITDLNATNKKKVLEPTVSRYLKLADAVMAGVANGIFPAK